MTEQFYTILTKIGKAKIANSNALGTKLNLTKFQVGDSKDSYYNPTEDQVELKNKVWEGPISNITIDTENPNWIVIEVVIPSSVGGFMIREAGVTDDEGNLIAIGKYPETYKPIISEGSAKDLIIRMILEVSNTSSVTLKVDPTVILATQKDLITLEEKIKRETGKLKVLENTINLEEDSNKVSILDGEITAFNKIIDAIQVFKNSVFLTKNQDYKIADDGISIVNMNGVWKKGTTFTILVSKNVVSPIHFNDGQLIYDESITLNKLSKDMQNDLGRIEELDKKIDNIKVPVESVNNKTGKVVLSASDVGAAPSNHTHAEIGTLSSLKTSNKSNLVNAVNEVFTSGVDAKNKVVTALTSKDIEVTTNNTWDEISNILNKSYIYESLIDFNPKTIKYENVIDSKGKSIEYFIEKDVALLRDSKVLDLKNNKIYKSSAVDVSNNTFFDFYQDSNQAVHVYKYDLYGNKIEEITIPDPQITGYVKKVFSNDVYIYIYSLEGSPSYGSNLSKYDKNTKKKIASKGISGSDYPNEDHFLFTLKDNNLYTHGLYKIRRYDLNSLNAIFEIDDEAAFDLNMKTGDMYFSNKYGSSTNEGYAINFKNIYTNETKMVIATGELVRDMDNGKYIKFYGFVKGVFIYCWYNYIYKKTELENSLLALLPEFKIDGYKYNISKISNNGYDNYVYFTLGNNIYRTFL